MAFTFGDGKTFLRDYNKQSTATQDERVITRILNDANRSFRAFGEYDFDRRTAELTYEGIYDTGTITATLNSTTLSGSGTTFTAAMVGRYVRVNGDVMQYLVTAYTNATTLTITPAYRSATQTGVTYAITEDRKALPSDFRSVYSAQTDLVVTPMMPATLEEIKYARKFSKEINYPRVYAVEWYTGAITTDNVTPAPYLWIYPPPETQRVVEIWYYGWPLEMSDNSDVFGIPYQAEGVLREFMVAALLSYQRDPGASAQLGKARREAEISLSAFRSRKDLGQKAEWNPHTDGASYQNWPPFDPLAPGQPQYI